MSKRARVAILGSMIPAFVVARLLDHFVGIPSGLVFAFTYAGGLILWSRRNKAKR